MIKWKHFPHDWPFVWWFHWSLVNSPQTDWWHNALMFSLICTWTNSWVNNWNTGDFRCYWTNYDVTVMTPLKQSQHWFNSGLGAIITWANVDQIYIAWWHHLATISQRNLWHWQNHEKNNHRQCALFFWFLIHNFEIWCHLYQRLYGSSMEYGIAIYIYIYIYIYQQSLQFLVCSPWIPLWKSWSFSLCNRQICRKFIVSKEIFLLQPECRIWILCQYWLN